MYRPASIPYVPYKGWSFNPEKIDEIKRIARRLLESPESASNTHDMKEFLEVIAYDKDPSNMPGFSLLTS